MTIRDVLHDEVGLLSSVTLVSPDYAHDTTVLFSYSGGVVEERHFALVERFAFSNPGQLASYPGVFVMILYEIADNQIRVDKSLLAHRVSP
jgi:hypothetical protein